MPKDIEDPGAPNALSRRSLFKQLGLAGAATAISGTSLAPSTAAPSPPPASAQIPAREALETLTAAEADALEAIVARLIPTDENGPGATEARAAHYIDRALAGPLASSRAAYAMGLAAIDEYAQRSKGALSPTFPQRIKTRYCGIWRRTSPPGSHQVPPCSSN